MSDVSPSPQLIKPFRTVGVVGAGKLGAPIAHWCALHGYGIILCDIDRQAIERGVAVIRELFAQGVLAGTLSPAEAHKLTGGIGITTSLEDFEICDLVIEAIVEDLAAKQAVFAELAQRVDADCVLATCSASLPLVEIAAQATGLERAIGLKFPQPLVPAAPLEVMRHPQTSPETLARIGGLAQVLALTLSVP